MNKELKQLAKELKIENKTIFLGYVLNVPLYYSIFDILVLPSRWEPFSRSILEGLAYGMCMLASDVGGMSELIENKKSGILFPEGEQRALSQCLTELYQQPGLRKKLQKGARERSQCFEIKSFRKKILDLYTEQNTN